MNRLPALLSLAAAALLAPALAAQPALPASGLPKPLREVGFDQRLGDAVPLDLAFTDHSGASVRLGELVHDRPVVLLPVYYDCPMLCTMVLNGIVQSLKTLDFDPGREFDVVAFSFDPRETPELAAERRAAYLKRYGRPETEAGWHFLTGRPEAVAALTAAIGFRYSWDEASQQFAHAAGLVVLTPEGRVARYLFGVEFPPRDLRLALVEAADHRIGGLVDELLLYCYRYDPTTGRYSAVAINLVRLAGVATLLALGLFLTVSLRRERRAREAA